MGTLGCYHAVMGSERRNLAPSDSPAGDLASAGLTHRICFWICTHKINLSNDPLPRAPSIRTAFVLSFLLLSSLETSEQGEERETVFVGRGARAPAANEGTLNGVIVLLFI